MNSLSPDRKAFEADPLGYSAVAWQKWELAQFVATGKDSGPRAPSGTDLKNPLLWLTQAHALSEAARTLLLHAPSWESMPVWVRSSCDSQYCAAGLMLVGYSLEVCLKAMLILRHGIDAYTDEEKKYQHHKLERLGEFIPDLNPKDRAILRALTHYIEWTGRYPDPGGGRTAKLEEIFSLSEKHQVSGRDLFDVAGRIMKYANIVIEEHLSNGAA
ncbi:TPA: hypothetical protein ACNRUI_004751 [Pseudomonas aeruginosa]|nr:hypothetical protein [Pseudomonas aeruginosa]